MVSDTVMNAEGCRSAPEDSVDLVAGPSWITKQAVKTGYLPPRLYDHAVKREQLGWNISLKILEPPESALDWEEKEG